MPEKNENNDMLTTISESISNALTDAESREMKPQAVEEKTIIEDKKDAIQEEGQGREKEVEKTNEPKINEEFSLIPKEWNEQEKKAFESLLESDDPAIKVAANVFTDRYKGLRDDYHKKSMKFAELSRKMADYDDILPDSAKDVLKAKKSDQATYFKNLVAVDKAFAENPVETIKWLMEAKNINPQDIIGQQSKSSVVDDEYVDYDKKISDITKENEELRAQLKQRNDAKIQAAAAQEASAAKQVKDFKHAVDETGELLYPHFEDVKEEMAIYIKNGKATTLEQAYDMSPTIKDMKIEKSKKLDIEKEKRKVAKAKAAAKGVSSRRTAETQPSKPTNRNFEQLLKEKMTAANARRAY